MSNVRVPWANCKNKRTRWTRIILDPSRAESRFWGYIKAPPGRCEARCHSASFQSWTADSHFIDWDLESGLHNVVHSICSLWIERISCLILFRHCTSKYSCFRTFVYSSNNRRHSSPSFHTASALAASLARDLAFSSLNSVISDFARNSVSASKT